MKKIISYIFSFILIIALVASILMGIFSNTILSKKYFLKKLSTLDFYNGVDEEIKDTFQNYILQSGMDETVLENIYDREKLKQDVNSLVDAIYDNKEIDIETDSIKEKLQENIDKYLEEKNLQVVNQTEVENFKDTIAETYSDGIKYSKNVIEQIGNTKEKVDNICTKVAPIIYISTVIIIGIIVCIQWKNKIDIAQYLGISTLSAGIILIATRIYINVKINISGITLVNETVTNLIQNIAGQILNYVLGIGIVAVILGIIGIEMKIHSLDDKSAH